MASSARTVTDYSAPSVYEALIAPRYAPVADELAAAAGVLAGDHVLEIGAGTGLVTRRLAPLVQPEGVLVATDRSAAMLGIARETTGAGPVVFVEVDYTQSLPFPRESFDVAVSGLTYVQDVDEQVAELRRVLRPGGRFALTMWGADYLELRMMCNAKVALGDPPIPAPDADGVIARLIRAGLEPIERRDFELAPLYASVDDYIAYRRGFGVPLGAEPAAHERYLEALRAEAEKHRSADGTFTQGWSFSLITAECPRYP
jgi:SAM-dependent methyltransferase